VWEPVWIGIHWNRIWLRAWSQMSSHYTWGSMTTLHDFGSVLGQPLDTFFWALTISWSWLLARVWCDPYYHSILLGSFFLFLGLNQFENNTWVIMMFRCFTLILEFPRHVLVPWLVIKVSSTFPMLYRFFPCYSIHKISKSHYHLGSTYLECVRKFHNFTQKSNMRFLTLNFTTFWRREILCLTRSRF
jgi:hypothetical protein